jgi:hypothetical protein
LLVLSFATLATSARAGHADQTRSNLQQRFERLATATTHLATDDIVRNRWSERRWPEGLLEEQQAVLEEMRATSGMRAALQGLLRHSDPKVRTLALGALFIREDPRDLPLIAGLLGDRARTFPRLHASANSMGGRLPLSSFESDQTVGDVAREMIGFYLAAVFEVSGFGRALASAAGLEDISAATFEKYWSERGSRTRCASWFLVRIRRATRDTTPLQPEYEADARRVLADIDALPAVERAWTLLYVREDQSQLETLVPDAAMVAALSAVGPEALLKVLRREPVSDDPDLLAPSRPSWILPHTKAVRFILAHAPALLRASDADTVMASAEGFRVFRDIEYRTEWLAASVRLRGLHDPDAAAQSLKAEIQRIPSTRTLGVSDQAVLAFALWQFRGAAERAFLADWFYTALPFVRSPDAVEGFLRQVDKEGRPDTAALLAAVVGDARFDQAGWAPLARILEMVNGSLPSPLVDARTIYDHRPTSGGPDQKETLAAWRALLRQHFKIIGRQISRKAAFGSTRAARRIG